jgi:DNA polymerase III delta subunit
MQATIGERWKKLKWINMLYVIHGKDTPKARSKLTELLNTLQSKRPDASLFRLSSENWNDKQLNELLGSTGLFSPKYIVVLDGLLNNPNSSDIVSTAIAEMAASEHVCIIIEEKILAADLKKIEKHATKVQFFEQAEKAKKESPIVFNFAEAVAMKENKRAWIIFQDLVKEGSVAEEIHGVLWWQFKSLAAAATAKSAKESGLSPYVYQKSARAAGLWKDDSLGQIIDRLVDMYHQAHRGEIDFLIELEKFALSGK